MKHIFKSQDSHVLGVCLSHVSRVGVTVVCAWYTIITYLTVYKYRAKY